MAESIKQRMLKDREKLIEMYHQMRMSLTDIARKYGCSRQYVQLIFIGLGISRRKRQEALIASPRKRQSRFRFGPIQDSFIIKNCREMTDRTMARYLNKPAAAITYRRLKILGRKKMERRNFTPREDEFILKNFRRLTDSALAKVLDRSLSSVTHHRSRVMNLAKKRGRKFLVIKKAAQTGPGKIEFPRLAPEHGYSETADQTRDVGILGSEISDNQQQDGQSVQEGLLP